MAVERMEMINIVGHMDDIDNISRRIILSSSVHMVSAISEIQQNNFPILKAKENVDALIDYNYIKQYSSRKNLSETDRKVNGLMEIFELKKKIYQSFLREDYDFSNDIKEIDNLYETVRGEHERLLELNNEKEDLDRLEGYISYMKHIDVSMNDMLNMKFIKMKVGKLTRYNMDKLRKNYENITAVVFKLYQTVDFVYVLVFVPEPVEIEVERVLSSLDFQEFKIQRYFKGTPSEWLDGIGIRKIQINKEIDFLKAKLLNLKQENIKNVEKYYSRLVMEYKIEELKSNIACTNEFFYLTGWIPVYKKKLLSKWLGSNEEKLIVIYKEIKETREGLGPPTCLRNNYFLRPFESIVKLYGVPAYNELDPTAFVGISYMILFGAMFGDVGQGLVLFLIGEILNREKNRPNLGGVIARLGASSTIFGFLYGSLFGYENIIPALLVRPMDHINNVLIAAVIFGVALLSIGFIYNLVNSFKNNDIENGIFSKNGLAGLVFYWVLLYFILAKYKGVNTLLPGSAITIFLILLLALILFKEPLSNLIKGIRPLYGESKSDYYIEGGFGVVEILLSLFSNTVSFIRVGAFAINHVGLFMAFETLAEMMSNNAESALMIIIGNIVIIGLEGLIVFIQGLRLEYYELFSKYFIGTGYEYNPSFIRFTRINVSESRNNTFKAKKKISINVD